MSGEITVERGYTIADGEKLNNSKLRQMALPVARLNAGSVGPRELQSLSQQSADFVTGRFNDGALAVGSTTFTSATAVFTPTDVGRPIVGPGIQAGTVIDAWVDPQTVVLSQPALVEYTDGTITGTTLTSPSANFEAADNGRTIVGTGISAGTTMTFVTADTATLSLTGTEGMSTFHINGRTETGVAFTIVGRGRGWQLIVDSNGIGKLEDYSGFFGGILAIGNTVIQLDGTVVVGNGDKKLVIAPNGDATWGTALTKIGLTHEGKLFVGSDSYPNAPIRIAENGDVIIQDVVSNFHRIATGAIDPTVAGVVMAPQGGAITNPTNATLSCATRYARIYFRVAYKDGVTASNTSFVSASGNFTVRDVGKAIMGSNIPAGAYIVSVTNASTVVLSVATTASGSGLDWILMPDVTDFYVTNNAPIVLTTSCNVAARAYKNGEYGPLSWYAFALDSSTVPNPTFAPGSGGYGGGALNVILSDTLAGALLRYTTGDGTQAAPTTTTGTGPFGDGVAAPSVTVSLTTGTTVIKVIAYKAGLASSSVIVGTYVVSAGSGSKTLTPTFSPDGFASPSHGAQTVTIATDTPGAQIRYTKDGTTPTPTVGTLIAGSSGTASIGAHSDTILQAIAFKAGLLDSDVKIAEYDFSPL